MKSKYTNVGTEGHPDHGKSKLMAGTDCYVGWDKALEGEDTSVEMFVTSLYNDGGHPVNNFSTSWDEISELDQSLGRYEEILKRARDAYTSDLFMAAKTEAEYKRLYEGVWEVEYKSEERG